MLVTEILAFIILINNRAELDDVKQKIGSELDF